MADAYLGQISSFSFPFPPKYSAMCNGQLLGINQSLALFSLLGTIYGGDGRTTFALPNLQGQVPLHSGPSTPLGVPGGSPYHTLAVAELPAHTHTIHASGATSVTASPSPNSRLGVSRPAQLYKNTPITAPMAPQMIGATGDSQPHENRQPYLVINYCIALAGTFPSRN